MALGRAKRRDVSGAEKSLFVLAGEVSGDRLGASLLRSLKARQGIDAWGVGGDEMIGAGLRPIFYAEKIAVMGFADVALRLPMLLWRVERVVRAIVGRQPDAVILIDAQVFSQLVAKGLRRRGFQRPILLYVAPSVWAWKPERAEAIKHLYDEVFAVLPFEPRVMNELGGPTTVYVGHPASDDETLLPLTETPVAGHVALYPGSRQGELRRHMPILAEVAQRLMPLPEVHGFVLPTLPGLAKRLEKLVASWPVPVEVVVDPDGRRNALSTCVAAIATAGTTTLELGMLGLPHVDLYVPDRLQMRAYEKAGKPLIDLVNIVLEERVVPEIEPGADYALRIAAAMERLVQSSDARQAQRAGFQRFREVMKAGEGGTVEDAATRVLQHLGQTLGSSN